MECINEKNHPYPAGECRARDARYGSGDGANNPQNQKSQAQQQSQQQPTQQQANRHSGQKNQQLAG